MLCILYVNFVGMLLGIAAMLVERMLPFTWPRRWIWCVVIAISMAVPPIYRANHTSILADVVTPRSVTDHANHRSTGIAGAEQPTVWARLESMNGPIQPIWLTLSVTLIMLGLANALRIWRVTSSRNMRGGQGAIIDDVRVMVTESVGPATVGLWRSLVVVPRWVLALPGVQRRYILRHEEEHRRAHDAHLLFVASLSLLLLPWSLALWWQLRRLALAVELDCDSRVVRALGNPNVYGELLFKVAQASSRGPSLQPAFLGAGSLERRLTALIAPTQLRNLQRFLLPIAAVALLMLALSMPHPVISNGSNAAHVTTTPATTQTLATHNPVQ